MSSPVSWLSRARARETLLAAQATPSRRGAAEHRDSGSSSAPSDHSPEERSRVTLAKLERVAEQHQPIDARQRPEQLIEQAVAPQYIDACTRAEV
jgi:hypothetical protein